MYCNGGTALLQEIRPPDLGSDSAPPSSLCGHKGLALIPRQLVVQWCLIGAGWDCRSWLVSPGLGQVGISATGQNSLSCRQLGRGKACLDINSKISVVYGRAWPQPNCWHYWAMPGETTRIWPCFLLLESAFQCLPYNFILSVAVIKWWLWESLPLETQKTWHEETRKTQSDFKAGLFVKGAGPKTSRGPILPQLCCCFGAGLKRRGIKPC